MTGLNLINPLRLAFRKEHSGNFPHKLVSRSRGETLAPQLGDKAANISFTHRLQATRLSTGPEIFETIPERLARSEAGVAALSCSLLASQS